MIDTVLNDYPHVLAFLVALILSLVIGPAVIPLLRRLKFGQTVRDDGPQSHLVKTGVPTIGSFIFMIPLFAVAALMAARFPDIVPVAVATAGFWIIGLIDDLIKVLRKHKDGLRASQKMLLLLLVATGFSLYAALVMKVGTDIIVPFRGMALTFDLSWAFIPFSILVLLSTTNGSNMTDGLDGLAAGVTFFVMILLVFVAGADSTWRYAQVFSAAVAGGCLGFLAFNLHPAKVFMGDSGSLALGGAVGATAIVMKMPLILLIAGLVYALELLSVAIQVLHFKRTRKRFFKMAPLHHHFEMSGWKETRVVLLFWGVTLVLCVVAFLSLGLGVSFG